VRQLGQDFFTDMKWIGHDICVSFLGILLYKAGSSRALQDAAQ
jgi:hypothetical protein